MRSKKVSSSDFKSSFKKIVIELHKCADKHCGKIMSKKEFQEYKKEMDRIVKKCSYNHVKAKIPANNVVAYRESVKDMIKCTRNEKRKYKLYKKYAPKIKKRTKCIKKKCM